MVCEAFGCVPSVARRELLTENPNGYLWRILEYRAFKATKDAIDRAPSPDDEPPGAMTDLVNEITWALAQAAFERRNAADGGDA